VPPKSRRPSLPVSFARGDLQAAGFSGWLTWATLRASTYAEVAAAPMTYVVYRPSDGPPRFRKENPGGRFKGRDPTVPVETLRAKWVLGAHVIYIGKADIGQRRLREFGRFGAGEPIAHWGGRYIWQLTDSAKLLVAWHEIAWQETARDYELRLLARFAELYDGARPFANLTG
jgi:hypothetical protein